MLLDEQDKMQETRNFVRRFCGIFDTVDCQMLSAAENSLKMAQALQIKGEHAQAIVVCKRVIDDIKEKCEHVDVIELISVSLGLISESLEKTDDITMAAYYKRAQRQFLDMARAIKSPEEDDEVMSPGARRRELHAILGSLENARLPSDPQQAMSKIRESMENSRKQRIADMMESLDSSGKKKGNRKMKHESCGDWILDNPVKTMLLVVAILLGLFFLLLKVFVLDARRPHEMSPDAVERLKELENYIKRQFQNEL